jgi:hypothetical protein
MNTTGPGNRASPTGTWYRCLSCTGWVFCAEGNHHPWCMVCVNDQFDWCDGRAEKPEDE